MKNKLISVVVIIYNIEKYLDEYSYRLNRSIHKQTIFDNLITRMMNHKNTSLQSIKISR